MSKLQHIKIRVVVIGAGYMANKVHYPALASCAEVQIVAICDRNVDKLQDTAKKYQVEKVYSDYKKMLNEVVPDAVFAIGQPHTMFDIWMYCLEKRLNLFIEKPLGLNLHQARALAHVAEMNDCVTQVCFQRRASPMLQHLIEECNTRKPTTYASVEFLKNTPQAFLGARDHMYDDGVHAIDTLRHICKGEVIDIQCLTRRNGVPDLNFFTALLEFDSGAHGHLVCNWTSGYKSFRVKIHARSICAEADLEGAGHIYKDGEITPTRFNAQEIAGSTDIIVFGGFQAKLQEFLDCLRTGKLPSSHFSDALKTHIIAEKILAMDLLGR